MFIKTMLPMVSIFQMHVKQTTEVHAGKTLFLINSLWIILPVNFLQHVSYRVSHEKLQLMNSLECRLPNTGLDLKTFCSFVR